MRVNLLVSAIILSMIVLIMFNPVIPVLASRSAVQQVISSSMDGFAFTSVGCCPEVSTSLNGNIITSANGIKGLSQQHGSITIGYTTYNLQFKPHLKLDVQIINSDCSSGTTYSQGGEIELTRSDGTIIRGTGTYSWGTFPDCVGGLSTFTNFSGKIQDSNGQITKFFSGTDLLPSFQ